MSGSLSLSSSEKVKGSSTSGLTSGCASMSMSAGLGLIRGCVSGKGTTSTFSHRYISMPCERTEPIPRPVLRVHCNKVTTLAFVLGSSPPVRPGTRTRVRYPPFPPQEVDAERRRKEHDRAGHRPAYDSGFGGLGPSWVRHPSHGGSRYVRIRLACDERLRDAWIFACWQARGRVIIYMRRIGRLRRSEDVPSLIRRNTAELPAFRVCTIVPPDPSKSPVPRSRSSFTCIMCIGESRLSRTLSRGCRGRDE